MGVGVPSTVSRSSFSSLLEFKEYRHTGLKSHAVPLSRLHVEREREREDGGGRLLSVCVKHDLELVCVKEGNHHCKFAQSILTLELMSVLRSVSRAVLHLLVKKHDQFHEFMSRNSLKFV